jgi:hypothetical protein
MAPAFESDKVMFEIYRDPDSSGRHRVVYFTELDEHNKEKEINDAMRGDHIFDGYLRNFGKDEAKRAIARVLERLNAGEPLPAAEIERELKPFMA